LVEHQGSVLALKTRHHGRCLVGDLDPFDRHASILRFV
jgi:hypothetical protein